MDGVSVVSSVPLQPPPFVALLVPSNCVPSPARPPPPDSTPKGFLYPNTSPSRISNRQ